MMFLPLSGSGVEEADVVFSLEQTCEKPKPRAEEEEEDMEEESSAANLFLQMKENPEDLLQLAPHSGDAVISLTGAPNQAFLPNWNVCCWSFGCAFLHDCNIILIVLYIIHRLCGVVLLLSI